METVTIEIIDFDKYNPKRDQKTYTWCRLDNSLLSGPEFSQYSSSQILVWISIISEASKKKQKIIKLNLKYLKKTARTTEKVLNQTLELLQKEKHIRVLTEDSRADSDTGGFQENNSTTPTYERTSRTNDTNEGGESRINENELIQLFNDIVGDQGRVKRFPGFSLPRRALENFIETSGFPQFRNRSQWEKLLREEVLTSNFLMGKNPETTFVVNLQWLVEPDNAFNTLSGKYSGQKSTDPDGHLDSMTFEEGA